MRIAVTIILAALLALLQYPLWWGHGGWLHVHELQRQLNAQRQQNVQEKLRNDRMAGEVQDLQEGTAAVEERARYEMGMLKDGETFVQFVPPSTPASAVAAVPGPAARITSTRGEVSAQPLLVVPNPVSVSRTRGAAKKSAHAKNPAKKEAKAKGKKLQEKGR